MNQIRSFYLSVCLGLCVWTSACNTPTLPLPPPSESAIEARMDPGGEHARITGLQAAVEAYALVTCFNNRTGGGVVGIANGKGAFDITISASEGDVIEVWQRVANDPPSVVVQVR